VHQKGKPSRLRGLTARSIANRRVFPFLASVTVVLAVGVGLLVRAIAPRDFDSAGEGIWWAIVTLGTVGYGDVVPTSPWGRVVGGFVIIFGVTFLAFLTAVVTSMFVSNEQREEAARGAALNEARQIELRAAFRRLEERLDAIEARLKRAAPD
jgi:voltage-gated potassium channel